MKRELFFSKLRLISICASVCVATVSFATSGTVIYDHVSVAVSTLAGSSVGFVDSANPLSAQFYYPYDIAADKFGNVYVADRYNHAIRKIDVNGTVSTLAGSGSSGTALDVAGSSVGLSYPQGIAVDFNGTVYVSDTGNGRIIKITPAGYATLVTSSITSPRGLAFNSSNDLFVAGYSNNKIMKITAAGVVTTFAGSGTAALTDGNGTTASFNMPTGIAIDTSDNLFVADYYNNKIRKITAAGLVTTVVSGSVGGDDGNGTAAGFNLPESISVDARGNLFVSDAGNNRIRKIYADGNITTVAGGTSSGYVDVNGSTALFSYPTKLVFDNAGDLLVADNSNNRIRKITINKPPACLPHHFFALAGSGFKGGAYCFEDMFPSNVTYQIVSSNDSNLTMSSDGNISLPSTSSADVNFTFKAFDGELWSGEQNGSIAFGNAVELYCQNPIVTTVGYSLYVSLLAYDYQNHTSAGITFDLNITRSDGLKLTPSFDGTRYSVIGDYNPYFDYNVSYTAANADFIAVCGPMRTFVEKNATTPSGTLYPFVTSAYLGDRQYPKVGAPFSLYINGVAPKNLHAMPTTYWLDQNGSGYISQSTSIFTLQYDTNGTRTIKAIVSDSNDTNSSVYEQNISVYDPAYVAPYTYPLVVGWNLLSLPVFGNLRSLDINDSFGDVNKTTALLTYGAGEWSAWTPDGSAAYPTMKRFGYLYSGQGFWLKAPSTTTALTVRVPGWSNDTSVWLLKDYGWNLVGVDGDKTVAQLMTMYTSSNINKIKILWSYNNETAVWKFYTTDSVLKAALLANGIAEIDVTQSMRGRGLWALVGQ